MLTRVLEGCPPGTAGKQGLPCVRDVPQAVLVKEAVYNVVVRTGRSCVWGLSGI